MTILVTGGAGFIGSHITDALLDIGHKVIVLDDLSSGNRDNVSAGAIFVEGDIRDRRLIDSLFHDHSIDIVNHHAAQIDVRKSVQDPIFDVEVNIIGSINLLEAARTHGIKRFVFASTGGAIYGEQHSFPANEEHPQQPHSPYGISKRTVELYLEYYRAIHGMEYTAFRYTNVYGPRQDPKGEAGVVAIFAHAMISEKPTTIYGTGSQTRDYVYVGDVVRAHLLLLEKGKGSMVYNVSTAVETSVNELHKLVSDLLTDGKAKPQYGDARKGELERSVCSYEKIKRELGWQPGISLNDGLRHTVEYFKRKS